MLCQIYTANKIRRCGDVDEHLRQSVFQSPYEAVKACLSPDSKFDYLIVGYHETRREVGRVSPREVWGDWTVFTSLVDVHIKSTKIQLGEDETLDEAAKCLIRGCLERRERS
jgi:hypothetical protein